MMSLSYNEKSSLPTFGSRLASPCPISSASGSPGPSVNINDIIIGWLPDHMLGSGRAAVWVL